MNWRLVFIVTLVVVLLNLFSFLGLSQMSIYSSHIHLYWTGLAYLCLLTLSFASILSTYINTDDQSRFLKVFGISMFIKILLAMIGFTISYKVFLAGKYYWSWYFVHYVLLTFAYLLTIKAKGIKSTK